MLPARALDPTGKMNVQIFEGWATVDLLQWRTWIKPRGKTMCSIFALSAGGAGGNGFTAAAAAARGGGGGGGSGAQFSWTGPLIALPNAMSVQVGGASTGAGISTRLSLVSNVTAAAANMVMFLAGGAVGGNGTGAAAGAAGTAAAIPTIAGSPLAGMGQIQLFAGQAGSAGGVQTGAAGAAGTIPVTGLRCMGGTGGGGVTAADQSGGNITAITDSWLSERRSGAAAAGSTNGAGGHFLLNPFWSWCGMGGGASNAGVGGQGGTGAFGSGGGGGGGGTTGGTGGTGGPGLVIITCW